MKLLSVWIAIAAVLSPTPGFQSDAFPLTAPTARSFVADADGDSVADLLILDGNTFTFYDACSPDAALTIQFPPETTAVDVADILDDGFLQIVALTHATVTVYPLVGENAGQARELFSLEEAPPGFQAPPFLHVMSVTGDSGTTLLIPQRAGLTEYALDGSRVPNATADAERGPSPFDAWVVSPSGLAGPEGLELRFEHAWQPGRLPGQSPTAFTERGAGPFRLREAANSDPERWPSTPLRTDGQLSAERVHLAVEGDETGETLVVVRRKVVETGDETRLGPVRRYPGQPLWQNSVPPDFNGDGFADLLLWRTRRPVPTVGSISRALSAGSWPIDISVHLFDPKAASFSPQSAGAIQVQTPIARFFDPAPGIVPFAAAGDFNGDGFTDFGCATTAAEFSVWLWSDGALPRDPAYVYRAPDALRELVFLSPLAEEGGMAIGLRTGTHLVLLRPVANAPKPVPVEDPTVRTRIRYLRGLVGSP